jgi:hypothetical protein
MANHGGTKHIKGQLTRGTAPKPSSTHHGSGKPLGVLHEAPTRPMVNDQNYGGHKVKRK